MKKLNLNIALTFKSRKGIDIINSFLKICNYFVRLNFDYEDAIYCNLMMKVFVKRLSQFSNKKAGTEMSREKQYQVLGLNLWNHGVTLDASQQTFVLMKTSFVFVYRRRLQDVLIKANIFALVIHLQKTSWSRGIYLP